MTNIAKHAGELIPVLTDKTISIEGKTSRLYDNEGRMRPEVVEYKEYLSGRAKQFDGTAKELGRRILAHLQNKGKFAPGNHTVDLGEKSSTSAQYKPLAEWLVSKFLDSIKEEFGADCDSAEKLGRILGYVKTEKVDAVKIDGKIKG